MKSEASILMCLHPVDIFFVWKPLKQPLKVLDELKNKYLDS